MASLTGRLVKRQPNLFRNRGRSDWKIEDIGRIGGIRNEECRVNRPRNGPAANVGHIAPVMRHPREMGAAEVKAFLTYLAVGQRVSAATQNQALRALLFLYRQVLDVDLP
jgi:hypothetical protein